MFKVFKKTFGTFHPSTHLKHTLLIILSPAWILGLLILRNVFISL
jgi:hypothetical protein